MLRPGVERLCQRLGLDAARLARYAAGSRPVYAAGDLVLKLFPPLATWPRWQMEPEVLAAVQGKLPTPTPQVHSAGEHDGWGYVLMSRLPGVRWIPSGARCPPRAGTGWRVSWVRRSRRCTSCRRPRSGTGGPPTRERSWPGSVLGQSASSALWACQRRGRTRFPGPGGGGAAL
jgi:hypothetical protein